MRARMRGWMDEIIHSFVPSSVVARWREELIACGYGGKEMKWWPLCRLRSDSIVVAATAVAMATIRMAMSCPTLSSSSSAFQTGCSSTRELTSEAHRLCSSVAKSSAVGHGSEKLNKGALQIRAAKGPPKQGRGSNSKKAAAEGIRQRMRGDTDLEGWTQVLTEEELPEGKNKAIIHQNAGYVIVKRDTRIYTVEANCTSCKFPMIEGKVSEMKEEVEGEAMGLRIECPLCHTKFSLEDGKVVEFCPKDGPVAWAVGLLKEKSPAVQAKVYPTRISKAGRVYVRYGPGGLA